MPSLLCLLFYDALSDHAFVILCVSMHLETDLPTPQETPTQRLSMGLKSETQVLVHSSSAARCGGTWDLDPVNFFLRDFFFLGFLFFWGIGPCGLVPPPPLACNSILPLVPAVLITPKGAESPGSLRIGVIGALVLILPSKTV